MLVSGWNRVSFKLMKQFSFSHSTSLHIKTKLSTHIVVGPSWCEMVLKDGPVKPGLHKQFFWKLLMVKIARVPILMQVMQWRQLEKSQKKLQEICVLATTACWWCNNFPKNCITFESQKKSLMRSMIHRVHKIKQ